ncbi:MAG: ABC transporter permease, partial [Bacteroidales bacterium]|nr:ABC transporter permease [Bacteroidales bacterium]
MHNILILFKREYKTAVKTKSFIVSILFIPILTGGSFFAIYLTETKTDTVAKKLAIIDHSGVLEPTLMRILEMRNSSEIFDPETGLQTGPAYQVEFHTPDTVNPLDQKLELSDRVRSKELHAFIEVGPGMVYPANNPEKAYLYYFSEHSFNDNMRNWYNNVINNILRDTRAAGFNIDSTIRKNLFAYHYMEGMSLPEIDKKTGDKLDSRKSSEIESFIVPYIFILLMLMLTMMSAAPLLSSVMEEKSEKIAEVLLAHITPFEFMMGKVMGGVGISITIAVLYVAGGIAISLYSGNSALIPYDILPWFFVFLMIYIVLVGAGMAALGSTCNDNKDAQSLQFPAMLVVIIPMFLLFPVLKNPAGPFATALSLFPPFTPPIMMLRLATKVTVPLWQPIVGIILTLSFTILTVWVGARIFRGAI